MPAKPRNTRGKHPHQSRKSKAKLRQGILPANPETSPKPVHIDENEKAVELKPATLPLKSQSLVYPYITGELKNIGILAAVIFVILIILAIVIS